MDTSITLWQFLLELLLSKQYSHLIAWTNHDGEFKLLNAEEVAHLWGLRKNKHNMNYDKLSRALRYYYDKNIIKKVLGQKFVYRFVSFPEVIKTENKVPFHVKMESIHKNLYTGDAQQQQSLHAHQQQQYLQEKPRHSPPRQPPSSPLPQSIPLEIKRPIPDDDLADSRSDEGSSSNSSSGGSPVKRLKIEVHDSINSSNTNNSNSGSTVGAGNGNNHATSTGGGNTTSSSGRTKHKPAPIVSIPTSPKTVTNFPSLQTPLVTFTSPFLPQGKTPPVPVALWSPLLPSPRYSGSGATHFQFPPHPLSPFFASPYSPLEPQSLFSPTKSIPVLQ